MSKSEVQAAVLTALPSVNTKRSNSFPLISPLRIFAAKEMDPLSFLSVTVKDISTLSLLSPHLIINVLTLFTPILIWKKAQIRRLPVYFKHLGRLSADTQFKIKVQFTDIHFWSVLLNCLRKKWEQLSGIKSAIVLRKALKLKWVDPFLENQELGWVIQASFQAN
ncbi:hypothetical protein AMTRI_Chr10g210 [Amborella trichopoda]